MAPHRAHARIGNAWRNKKTAAAWRWQHAAKYIAPA